MARLVLVKFAMGRAAAKLARGEGQKHPRRSKEHGADGLVPTIREFLPWHVIEKKMLARASGKQLRDDEVDEDDVESIDDAPDSGVYTSGQHAAANESDVADGDGLTYKVYTVADLEKRGIAADLSVNSTRMSMAILAAKQTPWADTAHAALVVLRLAKTWLTSPSPRPAARDVFRAPFVAFTFELRTAMRTVEWKKVGMYAGIALGTLMFLFFAVVTAAELTDDLKPARVATTTSGDSYTNAIVAAAHPTAKPKPVVAAAAPAPIDDALEFSEEPTPPPAPKAAPARGAKAKAKAGTKKKPASSEVFVP